MAASAQTESIHDGARSCPVCGSMLLERHLEETPSGVHCIFCGAEVSAQAPRGSAPAVPGDVGDVLREARLARHETLSDAARWTCVRSRYLAALEGNRTVDEFPGRIYARYFLREYAEHLGLDPQPLLRSFDRIGGSDLPVPKPERALRRKQPRWGVAALVSIVLLAGFGIFSLVRASSGVQAHLRPPRTRPSAAASTTPSHPTASAAVPAGPALRAVLVVRAPCWIAATVDGRTLPPLTYPAGRTLRYHGEHTLQLSLGNAGGVTLTVNGRHVPTGASGQPVQLSFAWRDGHLVQA